MTKYKLQEDICNIYNQRFCIQNAHKISTNRFLKDKIL